MPKALWSGYISFGLVTIPVSLVTAVRDKSIRFHLLHPEDGARLRQKLVCPFDAKEVGRTQAARGFEVAPGEYVIIEDEELRALAPEKSRTIEITDFVAMAEIDPIYYERPYYLVPREGGENAYSLLLQAMVEKDRIGVGKFVFHEREHVVALRPLDGVLCVEIMRFADEIVSREGLLDVPAAAKSADRKQMELARQLIDALATDFEPAKYRDEYREAVLDLIERKAKGEKVVSAPVEPEEGEVIDLMAALEKSLEKVKGKGKRKKEAGKADKPARKAGSGAT
ncbi:MAG: Ku protein [Actinomycetota bacterium]|nr:Ku protein [Actinomycetota bacterium]MDD5667277.1 Ku protein [Actinomycetota bacterium]